MKTQPTNQTAKRKPVFCLFGLACPVIGIGAGIVYCSSAGPAGFMGFGTIIIALLLFILPALSLGIVFAAVSICRRESLRWLAIVEVTLCTCLLIYLMAAVLHTI